MPKPIRHIAVIRLSALGDVAMTVPTLLAFTCKYPEVKITIVSRPFFEPIFQNIPNVSFVAVDVNSKHKGIFGMVRLSKELNNLGVDAVADLHNVIRSKVLTFMMPLSGVKCVSIDKGRAAKRALTRRENKVFLQLPSVFERNAHAFTKLGFPLDSRSPFFAEKRNIDAQVSSIAGVKSEKWIGIAPFAKHESKVYPMDLMKIVVDNLGSTAIKVFLFGSGKDEMQILRELASQHKNVVITGGQISFEQELQLISNLDAMLSMDSANAHLAAMFGIPVVTLWGATHPFAGFAPYAQPLENCILSDRTKYPMLPTSVYGNKTIAGYEHAMRTISPEVVIDKINRLIK